MSSNINNYTRNNRKRQWFSRRQLVSLPENVPLEQVEHTDAPLMLKEPSPTYVGEWQREGEEEEKGEEEEGKGGEEEGGGEQV